MSSQWDVVVVGAGPAGGMAAYLLAQQGRRVLLVEKACFPREKVCGCCLGARGARLLRASGLQHILEGAAELRQIEIRHQRRRVRIGIPTGYAISRAVLDERLAQAAMGQGAIFRPRTTARLLPAAVGYRHLILSSDAGDEDVEATLVLACDGIRGTLLDAEAGCSWRIAPDSWMGLAASVRDAGFEARPGAIAMHVDAGGYVGAVRLADGTLHFAAAIDPQACKRIGGPATAMQQILGHSGAGRCAALDLGDTKGMPLLTRERLAYGAHRVLALGDACGYIEPFTGEGMTWALESAALLAKALPHDLAAWPADMPAKWQAMHRRALASEQRLCRAVRFMAHRPRLMAIAMEAAGGFPAAAEAIAATLNRSAITPQRSGL